MRRRGLFAALMVGAGLLTGAALGAEVLFTSDLEAVRASAATPSVTPAGGPPSESPDLLVKTSEPAAGNVALEEFIPSVPGSSGAGDQTTAQPQNHAAREAPEGSQAPLNVLVLGVDTRPGAGGEYMGTRSDTMIVVQVTPGTGRVEILSIPRDLLVELWPGVHDRINTAYSYGGVALSRDVVEGLTGIPIDHYAVVDFRGFEEVIDAMGGVEVDVEDEVPPKYGIQDGPQTLNGRQALFYARFRGTAGGDLDRIRHQQRLIGALREQVLSWNTLAKLPPIVGTLMSNVDTDVGPVKAISLARVLVSRGEGTGMDAVQLRGFPTTLPNGDQVLVPDYQTNERLLQDFRE
ncbi:MAG TPA: LCP family protein [Rubrobacteraceae bacterium]|nr:LCP family protein [Rubrobacteraceae bacterium]